jgi:micrococcal nuclease
MSDWGVRRLLRKSAAAIVCAAWFAAASVEAATTLAAQPRPHGARIKVEVSRIRIMDGDSVEISWSATEKETVRVLGIDTPELYANDGKRHPAGAEARGFAKGTFSMARDIQLLRAATLDRFHRTLGYFFLDGRNYSVMVLHEGMATETVSRFGDNGFPREAAEVIEASRAPRRGR